MTDYQQIVDEIRFAIQSEDCELTETLRQAAQDYALACREVNQRLRDGATPDELIGGLAKTSDQLWSEQAEASKAAALAKAGVQLAQGLLYSEPLQVEAFIAWHAAHR